VGTCLKKKEANPKEMETVAKHCEVPNEEAAVETITAPEDRYGNRHVAEGCH
jgi:hypothetical protein